jgi:ABC-type xylose transport system permease subunit
METSKADRLSRFRTVLSNQAVSMLLILILMWLLLSLLSPYFFTASNFWEITLQTA